MSANTSQPQGSPGDVRRAKSVASRSTSSSQASVSNHSGVHGPTAHLEDGPASPPSLAGSDTETVSSTASSSYTGGAQDYAQAAQPTYDLNHAAEAPARSLTLDNLRVLDAVTARPAYSAMDEFLTNNDDARHLYINCGGRQPPGLVHGRR